MNTPVFDESVALDTGDLALLADLRATLDERDPVPSGLTERVKFDLTVAALHAEVAQLMDTSLTSVRSATEYERAGSITFSGGGVTAMISIEPGLGGRVTLVGWLNVTDVDVELQERSRTQRVRVDAEGRFTFEDVRQGLVHFVLRRLDAPGAAPVITPGVEV